MLANNNTHHGLEAKTQVIVVISKHIRDGIETGHTSVIPVTWLTEGRGTQIQDQFRQLENSLSQNKIIDHSNNKSYRCGSVVQPFLSMHKALCSIPSSEEKKTA